MPAYREETRNPVLRSGGGCHVFRIGTSPEDMVSPTVIQTLGQRARSVSCPFRTLADVQLERILLNDKPGR